jgi:hypothetical protein
MWLKRISPDRINLPSPGDFAFKNYLGSLRLAFTASFPMYIELGNLLKEEKPGQ